MEEIDYEKLRLDILQKLIDERGISCKSKKDEIIKYLKMDDEGKYIRETINEKNDKNIFLVGIDIKNQKHLIEIGNLIFKKEASRLNRYSDNRIWYKSNQKLI
jgi:hypothetical protein